MNRIFIGLLLAGTLTLTACGGGGSTTPATQTTAAPTATPPATSSEATAPPLPATGTPTGNLASVSTQESIASEGLAAVDEANTIVSLAQSGGSLSKARRAAEQLMKTYHKSTGTALARVHPLAAPSVGPCESGVEESTTDGPGADEEQISEDIFYDSACTEIEDEIFEDVVATSSTTGTVNATYAEFNTGGTQTAYIVQVFTLSAPVSGTEEATITDAISTTEGGTVYANLGASCGLGTDTLNCGAGSVVHGTTDSGVSLLFNATYSTTNLNFSGTDQLYTGAANALTLAAGTFPQWNVNGGTLSASATVSANFSTTSVATITVTDATNGGTMTITQYQTPTVTTQGILRETSGGIVAATFSINDLGNGTINYSNGTTGTIANFVIQP